MIFRIFWRKSGFMKVFRIISHSFEASFCCSDFQVGPIILFLPTVCSTPFPRKCPNIPIYFACYFYVQLNLCKSFVKRPLKKDIKILMTNGSLMKVKCIAECSPWSILQYFSPALSNNWSWNPIFSLFESGHFTQILLYFINCSIPAVSKYFQAEWKAVWSLIRWLPQKPADLNIQCFQKRINPVQQGKG